MHMGITQAASVNGWGRQPATRGPVVSGLGMDVNSEVGADV